MHGNAGFLPASAAASLIGGGDDDSRLVIMEVLLTIRPTATKERRRYFPPVLKVPRVEVVENTLTLDLPASLSQAP